MRLPDVLVCAAGGILGEAWMSGVLAGVEDAAALDFRDVEDFVGTSAGSIVAARLAAGERPRRPGGRSAGPDPGWAQDADALGQAGIAGGPPAGPGGGALRQAVRGAARAGATATAPFVAPALAFGAPAGARLRALALSRVPDERRSLRQLHAEIERLGSRFDGRLRVCTVDVDTGRRVVFGRAGSPRASVADAVVASCSIPWVFRPVKIGGRRYVDGGAWSLTNLDTAPAGRDSDVLCLNPSGSRAVDVRSLGGLARAGLAVAADVEALALRGRGAEVRVVGPDAEAANLMGTNFMDPRPARRVLEAGYRQGLALGRE